MTREEMSRVLDEEIAKLEHVRQLLEGPHSINPSIERFVRQTGATSDITRATRTQRMMSEEGRRRIAEAQKRRWAKQKGLPQES